MFLLFFFFFKKKMFLLLYCFVCLTGFHLPPRLSSDAHTSVLLSQLSKCGGWGWGGNGVTEVRHHTRVWCF